MMEAQIYYRRMLAGERQSLGLNRDFGAKEYAEPTLRSGREEHNNLLAAGRCGKADYIRIYRVYMEPTAQVKHAKSEQAS